MTYIRDFTVDDFLTHKKVEKTPHILPLHLDYRVSFVSILTKIYHVIMRPHCSMQWHHSYKVYIHIQIHHTRTVFMFASITCRVIINLFVQHYQVSSPWNILRMMDQTVECHRIRLGHFVESESKLRLQLWLIGICRVRSIGYSEKLYVHINLFCVHTSSSLQPIIFISMG